MSNLGHVASFISLRPKFQFEESLSYYTRASNRYQTNAVPPHWELIASFLTRGASESSQA